VFIMQCLMPAPAVSAFFKFRDPVMSRNPYRTGDLEREKVHHLVLGPAKGVQARCRPACSVQASPLLLLLDILRRTSEQGRTLERAGRHSP
jgi:hypothetical protein